eukprot:Nk52_evm10s273 gene=Nk52_evmTU10s273
MGLLTTGQSCGPRGEGGDLFKGNSLLVNGSLVGGSEEEDEIESVEEEEEGEDSPLLFAMPSVSKKRKRVHCAEGEEKMRDVTKADAGDYSVNGSRSSAVGEVDKIVYNAAYRLCDLFSQSVWDAEALFQVSSGEKKRSTLLEGQKSGDNTDPDGLGVIKEDDLEDEEEREEEEEGFTHHWLNDAECSALNCLSGTHNTKDVLKIICTSSYAPQQKEVRAKQQDNCRPVSESMLRNQKFFWVGRDLDVNGFCNLMCRQAAVETVEAVTQLKMQSVKTLSPHRRFHIVGVVCHMSEPWNLDRDFPRDPSKPSKSSGSSRNRFIAPFVLSNGQREYINVTCWGKLAKEFCTGYRMDQKDCQSHKDTWSIHIGDIVFVSFLRMSTYQRQKVLHSTDRTKVVVFYREPESESCRTIAAVASDEASLNLSSFEKLGSMLISSGTEDEERRLCNRMCAIAQIIARLAKYSFIRNPYYRQENVRPDPGNTQKDFYQGKRAMKRCAGQQEQKSLIVARWVDDFSNVKEGQLMEFVGKVDSEDSACMYKTAPQEIRSNFAFFKYKVNLCDTQKKSSVESLWDRQVEAGRICAKRKSRILVDEGFVLRELLCREEQLECCFKFENILVKFCQIYQDFILVTTSRSRVYPVAKNDCHCSGVALDSLPNAFSGADSLAFKASTKKISTKSEVCEVVLFPGRIKTYTITKPACGTDLNTKEPARCDGRIIRMNETIPLIVSSPLHAKFKSNSLLTKSFAHALDSATYFGCESCLTPARTDRNDIVSSCCEFCTSGSVGGSKSKANVWLYSPISILVEPFPCSTDKPNFETAQAINVGPSEVGSLFFGGLSAGALRKLKNELSPIVMTEKLDNCSMVDVEGAFIPVALEPNGGVSCSQDVLSKLYTLSRFPFFSIGKSTAIKDTKTPLSFKVRHVQIVDENGYIVRKSNSLLDIK